MESFGWKINMEHNHGGLEDHFPFQMVDWLVFPFFFLAINHGFFRWKMGLDFEK